MSECPTHMLRCAVILIYIGKQFEGISEEYQCCHTFNKTKKKLYKRTWMCEYQEQKSKHYSSAKKQLYTRSRHCINEFNVNEMQITWQICGIYELFYLYFIRDYLLVVPELDFKGWCVSRWLCWLKVYIMYQ